MKTNNINSRFNFLGYLLFLPFILIFSCQGNIDENPLGAGEVVNKDAKIISLMKSAVQSNSENDDQCTEFAYPIMFYVRNSSGSIELIEINNDEELIAFIDQMGDSDQLSFDFPFNLLSEDKEVTVVNNLDQFEEILRIVVDACGGSLDYDYCDDKNKKVYICHKGNTICVSINAVWGHLSNHEDDFLGECAN
jgi:hypothetical protein